jgi:CheY-like chemotaxis protein
MGFVGRLAPAYNFQVREKFAFCRGVSQAHGMTKPLALISYEQLLPGSQLVNRLQDLGYRVQTVADAGKLVEQAERAKPLVVIADLASQKQDLCAAIARLKQNTPTKHIPVLAFAPHKNAKLQAAARTAGATLVASDTAILAQFPQLLEQALQVD